MRLNQRFIARLFDSFLLIGSVVLCGCSAPATATQMERDLPDALPEGLIRLPEASRPFIVVAAAEDQTADSALRAPARVEFRDGAIAQLGAPLDGRVVRVHVRSGDAVRAGDPLVTLDCPEAAAVRAAVDTAMASLREAHAAVDRERRMLDEGVGIEREKLEAETKASELEAELSRARANAAFVGTGSGTAVMVRAPIAGIVTARKATEGMAVQHGGDALVEIGDPSAVWVIADVFERDLVSVRTGAVAHVELPEGTLEGHVTSIGAVVASGLRTAPVRISITSDTKPLRPGMYGRAEIAVASGPGKLTLPTEAVLVKGKNTIVYVQVNRTTFARRTVVVGQPVGGRVPVISGVAAGDRVVVHGALLLDGAADQLL
jgi:cobalt-zinc-cadmium efflux system membrane fusion protein